MIAFLCAFTYDFFNTCSHFTMHDWFFNSLTGAFEALGPRDTMEDRHVIVSPFAGYERAHLFGVFDGHRGHQAAEFCSRNIETALLFALSHRFKPSAALQAAIDMLEEGIVLLKIYLIRIYFISF
mmetsp:Transcript_21569/g.38531  ORF Transcript_21569/g.38531 Transcript_21569/m.38531 type:complete len:125 (+) Transcript_21569:1324-1698(+)